MNKLFTKIATAFVGMAMAVGVGVAVGVNNAKSVKASDSTISCSERASTLGWVNGTAYTEWKSADDIFTVTAVGGTNDGKWYSSSGGSWRIYNGGTATISCSSDYTISAVESSPSKTWTVNGQSASFSASSRTDFTSFTITYSTGGTTTYTVSYNAGDHGTGTMTDSNAYEAGDTVTVLPNGFTAESSDYEFRDFNTAADGSGTTYEPGDDFEINSNVTLYAQWDFVGVGPDYSIEASSVEQLSTSPWSSSIAPSQVESTGSARGWQWGSTNSPVLTYSNEQKVAKVIVYASTNQTGSTIAVSVGGSSFGGEAQSIVSGTAGAKSPYTFEGDASGDVEITLTNAKSAWINKIEIYFSSVDPSLQTLVAYDWNGGSADNPAHNSSKYWSKNAGNYRFVACADDDLGKTPLTGVEFSSSKTDVATVTYDSLTGIASVTSIKPGTFNLVMTKDGYNSGYATIEFIRGTLEEVDFGGSMSTTSYTTNDSWSADGLTVAGTFHSGWEEDITSEVEWTFDPASPSGLDGSVNVTPYAHYDGDAYAGPVQLCTVEPVLEPIVLNSSNWPVTATATHTDAQEKELDGVTYENVGSYIYSNQLSINYKVNNYFGNKTAYSRNIKQIVVNYSANVTSYVKMYEASSPLTKGTLVSASGTTSVTYTFSDTNPYFRLNMDTSTPKGTYCNITSIQITLGSAADKVDLEDISLNGDKTLPVGIVFNSVLTLDPLNANNKDTISWNSSNPSVATVDGSGVVTTLAVGQTTITATATDLTDVSASYVITTYSANPIEKYYYCNDGTSVDVNGYYAGFITGTGPIIMNGEFGIVLYSASMDCSGYTVGETILNVKGSLKIYSGLYEVASPSVTVLESASDVSDPVIYSVTGGETYIHESRQTYVSGTVVSVTGGWTSDTTVVMNVNGHEIQCFAKANSIESEDQAKIVADANITLKGFTGWHNGFQVTITGTVQSSEDYTAEDFAQDLLDDTQALCAAYVDGESDYDSYKEQLTAIWTALAGEDKYQSLAPEQKTILGEADADESGTVVEQAMARYDFLTGKYKLNNFINGRTPVAAHEPVVINSSVNTNNAMIIVTVIALTSVSAIAVLLVIKRRKTY